MKQKDYVIVRADRAGVFFGKLENKTGDKVTLSDCRKLFYWRGACAVEQIAKDGIVKGSEDSCQFTVTVEESTILGVIQVLPCTEKSIKSIKGIKEWKK